MYENFLINKSIFFRFQTLWLVILFFAIRLLSFFLMGNLLAQGLIVFFLMLLLGVLFFKNQSWAWCLVLAEIFLGGSGQYFQLLGLSIRTLLVGLFMFLWLAQLLSEKDLKSKLKIHGRLSYLLIIFFIFLGIAAGLGLYHGHPIHEVMSDIVPFLFLLLLFPTYHLFSEVKVQEFLVRLLGVFIMGTAIFSLATFIIYSAHFFEIHQGFYNWYRNFDAGKITDLGQGFFRIVETTHLLVVPFILLISSLLVRAEKHHKFWYLLLVLANLILVLNLSRAYFLALAVGLMILKFKHSFKQWFKIVALNLSLIALIFTSANLLASQGQTLGWELFGVRIQSLANPQIEISTNTRMMVLRPILDLIHGSPLLGVGLGATVTFLNTYTYQYITTGQFDWGYLEMWAELGVGGALFLLLLYLFGTYQLIKKIRHLPDWPDFDVGLLAGLIALLVMNVAMPALFHIFGILFLTFTLAVGLKQTTIFDRTTKVLYQIFNHLPATKEN